MAKRKGVFMGFYGKPELKNELQRRATAGHRTLSAELAMRLERSLRQEEGEGVGPGQRRGGGIGAPRP